MIHLAARLHAFVYGLFKPHPRSIALSAYEEVEDALAQHGLTNEGARAELARRLMDEVLRRVEGPHSPEFEETARHYAEATLAYEGLFELPKFDWSKSHSIAEYWQLQDDLKRQRLLTENMRDTIDLVGRGFFHAIAAIRAGMPNLPNERDTENAVIVPTDYVHAAAHMPQIVNDVSASCFDPDSIKQGVFDRQRERLEANLILASGGNPNNAKDFAKQIKYPAQSDIKVPEKLIATYLGGTPLMALFRQTINFAIPEQVRFEHHHIVAGSGHGKNSDAAIFDWRRFESCCQG